jgi:fibronectin type 3 domain-containing protein
MKTIIIMLIVVLMTSCGFELERKNPLDPEFSGVAAPGKVIVDQFEPPYVSVGSVLLEWSIVNNAVGYKIYRSLSYNGNYELIAEKLTIDDGSYEDISEELVSDTWYYYKVSAFNSEGLEGYRSDPIYTYFINESSQ